LVGVAEDRLGGADLVVNNAGVAVGGRMESVTVDDWKWIVDINLWGVIHGCRAFVPYFRKQGRGAILNVASIAGLISAPEMSPYKVHGEPADAALARPWGERSFYVTDPVGQRAVLRRRRHALHLSDATRAGGGRRSEHRRPADDRFPATDHADAARSLWCSSG